MGGYGPFGSGMVNMLPNSHFYLKLFPFFTYFAKYLQQQLFHSNSLKVLPSFGGGGGGNLWNFWGGGGGGGGGVIL